VVIPLLRRSTSALALGVSFVSLLTLGAVSAAAASTVVECGQLTGYVAPDPIGPADGSVQLGLADSWPILASATLSPAAEATLPSIVNSGPTCLAMDLDGDGAVTALDLAATGSLSGTVDFDAGSGFYIFADRLIIPTFVTDANPGLAALFVTSFQAGTPLGVTFSVDTINGGFSGFDGTAAFCGAGSVTSGGDGQVGDAIIAAALLDSDALDALAGAGTRETCATIQAIGSIAQDGAIDITTTVAIDVAAPPASATAGPAGVSVTPPPTSTDARMSSAQEGSFAAWLTVVVTAVLAAIAYRGPRRHRAGRPD
jgi:hypothetical protein